MTAITARGWPGLARYVPPPPMKRTAVQGNVTTIPRGPLGLRSYDLWLLLELEHNHVQAWSGGVQLALIDFTHPGHWCDPLGTVKTHPYGLWRAYQPNCAIVGYDLGYQIGQLAEFWQTTRDGAFRIFPYGWGKESKSGKTIGAISPHRPPILMRPRTKGWHIQFANPKSGAPNQYGKWVDGAPFRGNFIDLESVEHALGA